MFHIVYFLRSWKYSDYLGEKDMRPSYILRVSDSSSDVHSDPEALLITVF